MLKKMIFFIFNFKIFYIKLYKSSYKFYYKQTQCLNKTRVHNPKKIHWIKI